MSIAFTRWLPAKRVEALKRMFGRFPKLNQYCDGAGVLAYRVGSFEASTLVGVKDFTVELLAARRACCEGCDHLDAYEYMGERRTLCAASPKPNCHEWHAQILHNDRPCPKGLLPVEIGEPAMK